MPEGTKLYKQEGSFGFESNLKNVNSELLEQEMDGKNLNSVLKKDVGSWYCPELVEFNKELQKHSPSTETLLRILGQFNDRKKSVHYGQQDILSAFNRISDVMESVTLSAQQEGLSSDEDIQIARDLFIKGANKIDKLFSEMYRERFKKDIGRTPIIFKGKVCRRLEDITNQGEPLLSLSQQNYLMQIAHQGTLAEPARLFARPVGKGGVISLNASGTSMFLEMDAGELYLSMKKDLIYMGPSDQAFPDGPLGAYEVRYRIPKAQELKLQDSLLSMADLPPPQVTAKVYLTTELKGLALTPSQSAEDKEDFYKILLGAATHQLLSAEERQGKPKDKQKIYPEILSQYLGKVYEGQPLKAAALTSVIKNLKKLETIKQNLFSTDKDGNQSLDLERLHRAVLGEAASKLWDQKGIRGVIKEVEETGVERTEVEKLRVLTLSLVVKAQLTRADSGNAIYHNEEVRDIAGQIAKMHIENEKKAEKFEESVLEAAAQRLDETTLRAKISSALLEYWGHSKLRKGGQKIVDQLVAAHTEAKNGGPSFMEVVKGLIKQCLYKVGIFAKKDSSVFNPLPNVEKIARKIVANEKLQKSDIGQSFPHSDLLK